MINRLRRVHPLETMNFMKGHQLVIKIRIFIIKIHDLLL